MADERHFDQPPPPYFSLAEILEAARSPQDLAATMSEGDLYDLITVLDEDLEADRATLEQLTQRINTTQYRLSIAQEALKLARDKGVE